MQDNIIFKNINDDFLCVKLNEYKLIIMKKNGYINATKLCNDHNKEYSDWIMDNRDLVDKIKYMINKSNVFTENDEILESVIDIKKNKSVSGIYVHPLLIRCIAKWISSVVSSNVDLMIVKYELNRSKKYTNEKSKICIIL